MTTNSRKKRVNILDLIVVLAVIAVVALGAYMLFGDNGKQQAVSSNVQFTVEVTKQDKDVLDYMEEGQTIYDGATKNELGTIVSIQEKPSRTLVENHNAKTVEYVEVPEKIDVILEIEAKAKMEYPNVIVDTVSLKIGKQIYCTVGDAALEGVIIGMDYDTSLLTKKEETK